MPKKSSKKTTSLTLARISRTLFFFAGFYALSIVIFDSGNLITREAVIDRWTLLSGLLVVNTLCWLISAQMSHLFSSRVILRSILAVSMLVVAGLTTYWERGMASTSTLFYVLPLLIIVTLKNRRMLLATATLAATTYAFATVKYFNDFFNEGYRIQLWGHIVLYGGTIFVCAWLLMVVTNLRHDSR
jgi:hypothetical protein